MTLEQRGMGLLVSPVRRAIVETLSNLSHEAAAPGLRVRGEGLTATELGERLGLHLTTVRFHVDQLIEGGLVLAHDVREGVGRPRRRYTANPGSLAEVRRADAYMILAELLSDALVDQQAEGAPISAEEAAERWVRRNWGTIAPDHLALDPSATPGHFLAKIGALLDLLQRWGYQATVHTSGDGRTAEIDLTHCPLRELALRNPNVACGVHRGLVRATMAGLGEPNADIGLTPFVEPHLCRARVTTFNDFAAQKKEQS